MFPIFTIFFLFIVILNLMLHRRGNSSEDAAQRFWEREFASNRTRRQDISALDYIQIPLDKLPRTLDTEAEQELVALASEKLLNLSGQSNTDLKLQYGVANLDKLSAYDANFTRFVTILPVYAEELIADGQSDTARELLEFAVECRADSTKIFTILAKLYQDAKDTDKIDELITVAESYDSLAGRMIVQSLKKMKDVQSLP